MRHPILAMTVGQIWASRRHVPRPLQNSAMLSITKVHGERASCVNAIDDLSMKSEDVLRVELEVFRREHADLNDAIDALQSQGRGDMLTLQRLKRKKLALKDRIRQIEDRLTPDIIA